MNLVQKYTVIVIGAAILTFMVFSVLGKITNKKTRFSPSKQVYNVVENEPPTNNNMDLESFREAHITPPRFGEDFCSMPSSELKVFKDIFQERRNLGEKNTPSFTLSAPKIEIASLVITDVERGIFFDRFPPSFPDNATKSGHCDIKFEVNAQGNVVNAITTFCTEAIFRQASLDSVRKWQYHPHIINGVPVKRGAIETTISYHLLDKNGILIPE